MYVRHWTQTSVPFVVVFGPWHMSSVWFTCSADTSPKAQCISLAIGESGISVALGTTAETQL